MIDSDGYPDINHPGKIAPGPSVVQNSAYFFYFSAQTLLTALTAYTILSSMNIATYTANMAEMRIRNIPENLHKRFKMLCVDEQISINAKIIQLVKEVVEKWEAKG